MRRLSFRESENERTESGGVRIEAVVERDSEASGGSAREHRATAMEEDSRNGMGDEGGAGLLTSGEHEKCA